MDTLSPKIKLIVGAVLILLIAVLALAFPPTDNGTDHQGVEILNLATVILGVSIGWLLSTLTSPGAQVPENKTTASLRMLATLALGYMVAKGENTIEQLLSPLFIFQPENAFRVIVFLSAMIVSLILTHNLSQKTSPGRDR